jgi:hypothetical protein
LPFWLGLQLQTNYQKLLLARNAAQRQSQYQSLFNVPVHLPGMAFFSQYNKAAIAAAQPMNRHIN